MKIKELIRGSNAIEGIYDEKEIEQSLKAWEYLKKLKVIQHYDLCKVQKIITKNQTDLAPMERGHYRTCNVRVGDFYAPKFRKVNDLMESFLLDIFKMEPIVAHIRFETIHPFRDGNGRVGRMLYWWHCLYEGEEPLFFGNHNRGVYYRFFSEDKINLMVENKWGIENRFTYSALVQTKEGKLLKMKFRKKPSARVILQSMPHGQEFLSLLDIKQLI